MLTRRLSARAAAALLTGALLGPLATAPAAYATPTRAELKKKIDRQSAALKQVAEDYNEARERLKANQKKVAQLSAGIPALERQVAGARDDFSQVAASSYKIGSLPQASVALAESGPDSMLRRLSAIDQLTQRRQATVTGLTAAQQRHAADRQELRTEVARQQLQVKSLGQRKKKIEADLDKFYALRREVYGEATSGGGGYTGAIPKVSGRAGAVVTFAYQAIGKPYVYGSAGPGGYDCSGLTLAAWRQAGKSLPHNAKMQWDAVARLDRGALAPGDLVFYTDLSHVGIYVGSGKVIHAPTFGESVKISPIGMMAIYGYGRPR